MDTFDVAKVSIIFYAAKYKMTLTLDFRSLLYHIFSLCRLNGIDKVMNFALQFRFSGL